MAGFNNTPPASEFRRPTSWGRTRRPKNLTGNTSTGEATVGNGVDFDAVPTLITHGHPTENQRFLHLLLIDDTVDNDGVGIKVWGWNHAFQSWGLLTDVNGNAVEIRSTSTDAVLQIFEIDGVDRVYFQRADVGNATSDFANADEFYAACSTF